MLKAYQEDIIPDQGFILYKFKYLFDTLLPDADILNVLIEETVCNVISNHENIRDFIVVVKPLKTGLEKMPYIYRGDEIHLLSEFSNIKDDLERDRNFFPLFYIYVHNDEFIKFSDLRGEIGESLADKIVSYIDEI